MNKNKKNMINIEKVKTKLRELIKGTIFENKVYLVGGCIRDTLLGVPVKDVDLMVDLPNGGVLFSKMMEKDHPEISSGYNIFERYGTARFNLLLDSISKEWIEIECVMPRIEEYDEGSRNPINVEYASLGLDASRRDFCCNALYQNIMNDEVLDPTGRGLIDLRDKTLMCPLDPKVTFYDDPLRAFRAVRFSCQKDFDISSVVLEAIKAVPESQIKGVSIERITDEFNKILMSSNPIKGINLLIDLGLMEYISPEFVKNWWFDQKNPHHTLTSGKHSLLVLEKAVIDHPDSSLPVRLSCLFHDISKAYQNEKKDDLNMPDGYKLTYHGHEIWSASMSSDILKRLKYSNDIIEKVYFLVINHMKIKSWITPDNHFRAVSKQIRKIVRELGDNLKDCMILIDADNKSHAPNCCMPNQVSEFWEALRNIKIVPTISKKLNVPVNGRDIMSIFGIPSGPQIKSILTVLQDWYDDNPELTKEELLELLREKRWKREVYYPYNTPELREWLRLQGLTPVAYPDCDRPGLIAPYPNCEGKMIMYNDGVRYETDDDSWEFIMTETEEEFKKLILDKLR